MWRGGGCFIPKAKVFNKYVLLMHATLTCLNGFKLNPLDQSVSQSAPPPSCTTTQKKKKATTTSREREREKEKERDYKLRALTLTGNRPFTNIKQSVRSFSQLSGLYWAVNSNSNLWMREHTTMRSSRSARPLPTQLVGPVCSALCVVRCGAVRGRGKGERERRIYRHRTY